MKLKLLFVLIIIYVLAGFGWWSYSLIKFSNNEYTLKTGLLQNEKQLCELKIVEESRAGKWSAPSSDSINLNGFVIYADTHLLNRFVHQTFQNRYLIAYSFQDSMIRAQTIINPTTLERLESELRLKKRGFTIEAILLTLLIAAGIFGVYFSVSFVFDLNKQQNNFLLSVTHELKTPIASIKLVGETMTMRTLPPEKQKELIGVILENAGRLQDMTENMLTAMQMESNRYQIRREEMHLSDLVGEMVHNFELNHQIAHRIEPGIGFYGDPVLIRMTLSNLIENAIKYSDHKPVMVTLTLKNENIILEVSDQGIGIDKKQRSKIFKKFYRIQDEETRETKGSGLGLFIVKQAVEKHKGKIEVRDNTPAGTIFRITFKALN